MMSKRIRGNKWSIQSKMTTRFLITCLLVGERAFTRQRISLAQGHLHLAADGFGYIWVTLSRKPWFKFSLVIADFLCFCNFCVLRRAVIPGPNSHCLLKITFIVHICLLIKTFFKSKEAVSFPWDVFRSQGFHQNFSPVGEYAVLLSAFVDLNSLNPQGLPLWKLTEYRMLCPRWMAAFSLVVPGRTCRRQKAQCD